MLAGVLALLLAIAGASSAHGGTITVWGCHQPNGAQAPLDGWDWNVTATGIYPWNFCDRADGYFGMGIYQEFHPQGSYGAWTFRAPANTTVKALQYKRSTGLAGFTRYGTFRGTTAGWLDDSGLEYCQPTGCTSWQPSEVTFNLVDGSPGLLLYLEGCTQAGGCDEFTSGWLDVFRAAVTLEDPQGPTFGTPIGPLTQDGALHGDAALSVQLADAGTGVYKLHASVDGTSFDDGVIDANGGKCQAIAGPRDFLYTVPCPLSASTSTTLQTARLLDGQHEVRVTVEDAAGNLTTVFHKTITTQNAPELTVRPAITGTAKLGQALSGSVGDWTRSPSSYAVQWLRCPSSATTPADADACSPLPGATGAQYLAGPADAYQRLMLRVTASNANGSTSALSTPSAIVADSQGRTAPPATGDGGSRDVVIVPIPPGGSTTTIIVPPGSASIAGLQNPLADQAGHVANGTNAAPGARIRITFERRVAGRRVHPTIVRSRRDQRWVIKGRITNPQGRAIGGAVLVTAWQVNGRWVAHTGVRTRADGRFTVILARGPSRKIRFVYFAFSDSTTYNLSNILAEQVATPVTLAVSPHATTNRGRAVTFRGSVGADHLPKGGVLVRLQGRAPGHRWRDVQTVHTRAGGRFAITYAFTETTVRTRYAFRVVVDKQADYPFEGGASRQVEVLVTP